MDKACEAEGYTVSLALISQGFADCGEPVVSFLFSEETHDLDATMLFLAMAPSLARDIWRNACNHVIYLSNCRRIHKTSGDVSCREYQFCTTLLAGI